MRIDRLKTPDTRRIWQRYASTKGIEDRNALVVHYSHLVESQAARLSRRLPNHITCDEIRSAAFEGLIQAIESYDPRRPAKFETFCQRRVTGAVMDWLRSLDPQSRTVRTFEKQRRRAKELLDSDIGFPPSHEEIAKRMNLTTARYQRLCRLSQRGCQVSFSTLESQNTGLHGGTPRTWDIGDRCAADPAERISRSMLADHLSRGFTEEEKTVLVLYYYEDLTMAEVGRVLGLSESRVSQIHKGILNRIRDRFGERLTEELVP